MLHPVILCLVFKIILRTSAVSSTKLGSILIFASCVVGTCNIQCGWVFSLHGRGPVSLFKKKKLYAILNIVCFTPLSWLVLVFLL